MPAEWLNVVQKKEARNLCVDLIKKITKFPFQNSSFRSSVSRPYLDYKIKHLKPFHPLLRHQSQVHFGFRRALWWGFVVPFKIT